METFKLFSEPRKFYTKMLQDIANAKKSIYLETYIYDKDAVGYMFREVLIKKAKQGIKIKILVDAWGSTVDKQYFEKLTNLGAEIRFFKEFRYVLRIFTKNHERNHRKLLIIDDNISYIGSANITESCLDWNELVLRLEGDIGKAFKKSFFQSWESSGKFNKKRINNLLHKSFEIIQEIPSYRYKSTEKKYAKCIENAKKEILIITPYFIPSLKIRESLAKAVKRKVKVKIILPLYSDVRIVDMVRNIFLGSLHQNGINIFYYSKKTLHSKLLIIDDNFFILGSSNLDYRSFLHQFELNLIGKDPQIIKELKKYFNEILASCKSFDYNEWKRRSSFKKFLEIFLYFIRRYL